MRLMMNKDLRKLELLQFVKAFLKKEYPLILSKKFSKKIMSRINKEPIYIIRPFLQNTLRIASAVTFAVVTLFLLQSFTANDTEYSKSTISNPNIIPSKNVINKPDECERNQNQEIKSDTINCK